MSSPSRASFSEGLLFEEDKAAADLHNFLFTHRLPPVPQKGVMNFAFEARSWKACVPKVSPPTLLSSLERRVTDTSFGSSLLACRWCIFRRSSGRRTTVSRALFFISFLHRVRPDASIFFSAGFVRILNQMRLGCLDKVSRHRPLGSCRV